MNKAVTQKSIFCTKVLFLRCKSAQPDPGAVHTATLADLLLTDRWKDRVEEVRNEQDADRQKALKEQLPVILPSLAEGSTLRPANYLHSGYVVLDLDAKDNPDVEDFDQIKTRVAEVPYVAYCGKSCRGKGWLMLVPISDTARHRDIYRALLSDFEQIGLKLDPSCINLNRLRFVSYDPDPYVNTGAVPYGKVLPAPVSKHQPPQSEEDLAELKRRVEEILAEADAQQIDLPETYHQQIQMLTGFAKTFGEEGRPYAHLLAKHCTTYDPDRIDRTYSDLLKHPEYKNTIGSFFYVARQVMGKHVFDDALAAEAEDCELE